MPETFHIIEEIVFALTQQLKADVCLGSCGVFVLSYSLNFNTSASVSRLL